jgi:DNA-binding MarR family transcriptional regulator
MEAATRTREARPRKADTELALKLGALMIRCMSGRGRDVFRMIHESGITFAQMKVLVELEASEEEERMVTALAETLGISTASASRAADGLVRKKLATRVEDPNDRRIRRLTLTATGRELSDRIISARLAGLEDFTASLEPDERRKLESALDALMERDDLAEIARGHKRRVRR